MESSELVRHSSDGATETVLDQQDTTWDAMNGTWSYACEWLTVNTHTSTLHCDFECSLNSLNLVIFEFVESPPDLVTRPCRATESHKYCPGFHLPLTSCLDPVLAPSRHSLVDGLGWNLAFPLRTPYCVHFSRMVQYIHLTTLYLCRDYWRSAGIIR